jgi:hypothetical protein
MRKHPLVTPAQAGVQGNGSALALGSRFRGNDDQVGSFADHGPLGPVLDLGGGCRMIAAARV